MVSTPKSANPYSTNNPPTNSPSILSENIYPPVCIGYFAPCLVQPLYRAILPSLAVTESSAPTILMRCTDYHLSLIAPVPDSYHPRRRELLPTSRSLFCYLSCRACGSFQALSFLPLLHGMIWSASIEPMSQCFVHTGQMPFCFSYIFTFVFSSNTRKFKVLSFPVRRYS